MNINKKGIFEDFIKCKLTIKEIASKYNINETSVRIIAEQYAKELDYSDISSREYYTNLFRKAEKNRKEKEEKEKSTAKNGEALVNKGELKANLEKEFNDFLNSNKSVEEYCNFIAVKIEKFEKNLILLKANNSKLYNEVVEKIEHNEKIRELMHNFVNSGLSKREFCEKNGYTIAQFDTMIFDLKRFDDKSFNVVKNKISTDLVNNSLVLTKLIKKVVELIKDGVQLYLGKVRKFNVLDYYSMTTIDFDRLVNLSEELNLSNEREELIKFKNIESEDFRNIKESDILMQDVIIDKVPVNEEIKREAIKILDLKKIPYLQGTYEKILKDLVKREKKKSIAGIFEEKEDIEAKEMQAIGIPDDNSLMDNLIKEEITGLEKNDEISTDALNRIYYTNDIEEKVR